MFKRKQIVNHRNSGVCIVKDISPLSGSSDNCLYYVLEPLYGLDKGSVIRVRVDNAPSLNYVLDSKSLLKILKAIDKSADYYIYDTKLRKTTYESVVGSGNLDLIVPLYVSLKKKKQIEGRLSTMDNQFFNKSEPIIYGNISVSIGIPYEKVDDYFSKFI